MSQSRPEILSRVGDDSKKPLMHPVGVSIWSVPVRLRYEPEEEDAVEFKNHPGVMAYYAKRGVTG